MNSIARILLIAFVSTAAGCAGTQFTRAEADSLKNGETTYDQLVARMGEPRRRGEVLKNNKQVKSVTYSYSEAAGKAVSDEVVPARAQSFFFFGDRLVGHNFVSSWAEDHTNFDETKLPQIAKGKTSKAEVIALLGKPSGYYVYPMIEPQRGEALVYSYVQVAKTGFMKLGLVNKLAIVTLDERGVVSNVEFTSASQ